MPSDPQAMATDDRTPTCPFCGCARHDSEWLHDGNVMETEALVDAMIGAFLSEPDLAHLSPPRFPADYPSAQHLRLRTKMEAALGTAIRNMPYLAALRAQTAGDERVEAGSANRLVILESPYAGDVPANEAYARACVRDSLLRGEAPIASHLLYTQPGILNDLDPAERQHGIAAGLAWYAFAKASVVYTDRGISRGMEHGIAAARAAGVPVEFRALPASTEETGRC